MIDVRIIAKKKQSGSTALSGSSGGTGFANNEGSSSAKYATRAGTADEATHALTADEATRASSADEATHAGSAYELDADSPTREDFLSSKDDDEAAGHITFDKGLTSKGDVDVDGSLTIGDGYGIDKDGNATLSTTTTEEVRNAAATVADRTIVGGSGYDMYVDAQGKSHLWVDELMVRVKAYFASLEIRKISYSGGTTIFSNAGSTICKVSEVYNASGAVLLGWKCYAVADDGTTRTMNWWKAGDQALCQTFNVASGVYENVANRYYWRLVLAAGQEVLEDGKTYDYVLLSARKSVSGSAKIIPASSLKTLAYEKDGSVTELTWADALVGLTTSDGYTSFNDMAGSEGDTYVGYDTSTENDEPAPGDVIVQVGSQTAASERGNVIMLATSTEDGSDANAPSLRMWHGISGFAWTGLTCIISPETVEISSKRFKLFSSEDGSGSSPIVMYRGEWQQGTQYYYYDQVSYNGELWTWLDNSSEPSATTVPSVAAGWTLTVQKGADGANGEMSEIVLDSGLAIVSADADGTISNISSVSGLPVSVSVTKGGVAVPASQWVTESCYVSYDGLTKMLDSGEVVSTIARLYPSRFDTQADGTAKIVWKFTAGTVTGAAAKWTAVAGNITIHIEYTDTDGSTVTLERTVAVGVTRDGAKGDTGDKGDAGDDAWTVVADPAIITLGDGDLTAKGNYFVLNSPKTITVAVAHGATAATITDVTRTAGQYCACSGHAKVSSDGSSASVVLAGIMRHKVEGLEDVEDVYVPYSSGWVQFDLEVQDGSSTSTVTATIPVEVDYTAHIGSLILNDEQFKTQIASLQATDEGLQGQISEIEQTSGEIALRVTDVEKKADDTVTKLIETGIDIESRKITLQADTTIVKNNAGEQIAVFNADGTLAAGSLQTAENGSGHIVLKDGQMEVVNPDGQTNIRFGFDGAYMILQFLDNSGNVLYDLGPDGLSAKEHQDEAFEEYVRYTVTKEGITPIETIEDLVGSVNDMRRLFTAPGTGVFSATVLLLYKAYMTGGAYGKGDYASTSAIAKAANGHWFAEKKDVTAAESAAGSEGTRLYVARLNGSSLRIYQATGEAPADYTRYEPWYATKVDFSEGATYYCVPVLVMEASDGYGAVCREVNIYSN